MKERLRNLFTQSIGTEAVPECFQLLLLGICLVGCQSGKPSGKPQAAVAIPTSPTAVDGFVPLPQHLLLTHRDPYSKLWVEVDMVEGAEPDPADLAALEQFLIRSCDKPGGVVIHVDDRIPREEAASTYSRSLALRYLDGPVESDQAFLYYLFYDSAISGEPESEPVCTILPFPGAVFVDHQFVVPQRHRPAQFRRRALQHEAAHALGLATNPSHSAGGHCLVEDCLMNAKLVFQYRRFLLGKDPIAQKELCGECLADLAVSRSVRVGSELFYHDGYYVRSESNYHVLCLPGFLYVHWGPLRRLDRKALAEMRAQHADRIQQVQVDPTAYVSLERRHVAAAIKAFAEDSFSAIQGLGERLAKAAE